MKMPVKAKKKTCPVRRSVSPSLSSSPRNALAYDFKALDLILDTLEVELQKVSVDLTAGSWEWARGGSHWG